MVGSNIKMGGEGGEVELEGGHNYIVCMYEIINEVIRYYNKKL